MLEAHDLRKEYRARSRSVVAVAGVSLKVGAGELVAVTGRSGSGKSTLLAMLGGLSRPSGGRVIVDGADVWSRSPAALAELRARRVGFVLQLAGLLPSLRAVDNVALAALLGRSGDPDAGYARAAALLADLGLADRLDAYPDELSGGEQRRVALARALVNDPPLVLADEPTADLDEETEREVVERLMDLHRRRGITLVLVTHSTELARRADRVVHLHAGRVGEIEERRASVAPWTPRSGPGSAAREAHAQPPPVGAGLGRFVRSFTVWTALVVAGILALDVAVGALQQRGSERRQSARSELQRAALQQLRADVEDVVPERDGSYRVTLFLQNLEPQRELHVTAPDVRVFVQVDRTWREVPSRSTEPERRVVQLTGRHRVSLTFTPDVTRFDEPLAGYYHVRISSVMLVSRHREPGGGLVDRTDSYYVYVKPHGVDDAELRRRHAWSGAVPAWIPMPAH